MGFVMKKEIGVAEVKIANSDARLELRNPK